MKSPPLNHIYLWSGWIDKLSAQRVAARDHPHPLPEVFLRITHISETILSILTKRCPNVPCMILFQSYVRYVWGPKKGTRGGLKWLIILIFKNLLLVNQQCQKIDTWHITLINLENRNPVDQMNLSCNSAVASLMLSRFLYLIEPFKAKAEVGMSPSQSIVKSTSLTQYKQMSPDTFTRYR